jgi:hypothetical protein
LSRRNMRFRQAQRRRRAALGANPAASRCRQPARRSLLSAVALAKADGEGGLSPHPAAEPASSVAQCPVLLVLLRRGRL